MTYSIIIADDHPIYRFGTNLVIRNIQGATVIGEAANGIEACNLIVSEKPDIAILDYEMPLLNGLDVCRRVLAERSLTKLIMLTSHKDRQFFDDAMQAGAMGYLLKEHSNIELVKCIHYVGMGGQYVDPELKNYLVEHRLKRQLPEDIETRHSTLTPSEKAILKLISKSKSTLEIAAEMFISANTVENHRANISRKLQLKGKNSVMKFAIKYSEML
jgi:two-component system, NarL family, response regulator DegU